MKKRKILLTAAIVSMGLTLSAGPRTLAAESVSPYSSGSYNVESAQLQLLSEIVPPALEASAAGEPGTLPAVSPDSFSLDTVAPYLGLPYTIVHNNVPYFSEEDLTAESFESYSELDDLDRCGVAYASIGMDLMPTEERGAIGDVKPTGWHLVKYDCIDGMFLYNRCHLIGYQLAGENANEKNLITGTRYLNVQGMLPFENMVANYVTSTGNHVLYRVTPIFEDENLLASGVLMEAMSVEDNGASLQFCVYAYNVQPGIIIDYATGDNCLDPNAQIPNPAIPDPASDPAQTTTAAPTAPSVPDPAPEAAKEPAFSQEEPQGITYILNPNGNPKKIHYPSCKSVKQMSDKNKVEYTGSRDYIISKGYEPCKNCNP